MNELRNITVRLSVTDKCQLACAYCNPTGANCVTDNPLDPELLLKAVASLHRSFSVAKLRFTGGEPLLVRSLPCMIKDAIAMGIPDVGVTTNGQLLADKAQALWNAGLRRVNISCDSLDEKTYKHLTHGALDRTLRGIEKTRSLGMKPIKLNMVLMRGRNDHQVLDVLDFALRNGLELRFLELMPIGLSAEQFQHLYVSTGEIRQKLEKTYRLSPCCERKGSTARRYIVETRDAIRGHIGFISPQSHPFCGSCRRLRITSQGEMIGCLAAQQSVSLLPALSHPFDIDDQAIADLAVQAFRHKHTLTRYVEMAPMATIGG